MTEQLKIVISAVDNGATKTVDSIKRSMNEVNQFDGSGAVKGLNNINTATKKVASSANVMGKTIRTALSFFSVMAIIQFGKTAVNEFNSAQAAAMGLRSVVEGTGGDFNRAQQFIQSFIADGLVPASDAMKTYQNLVSRGYGVEQIEELMNRAKDAAAYNRQGTLSMGEAIRGFSEGLKNENSVLVDNAGITKNVSVMWKEYALTIGKTANELTLAEKRQAEYLGVLQETVFQQGNAAQLAGTFQGSLAMLVTTVKDLAINIGQAISIGFGPLIQWLITGVKWVNAFVVAIAQLFGLLGKSSKTSTASANGLKDVASGIGDVGDAAKKANKNLAKFDELQVMSSGKSASSSAGGVAVSPIEVDTTAATSGFSGVSEEIQKMANVIKDALKYVDDLVGGFKNLIPVIVTLGITWAGIKILSWVSDIGMVTRTIKNLANSGASFSILADSTRVVGEEIGIFSGGLGKVIARMALLQTESGKSLKGFEKISVLLNGTTTGFKSTGEALGTFAKNVGAGILALTKFVAVIGLLVAGFALLIMNITKLVMNWDEMDKGQRAAAIGMAVLGAACIALGVAIATGFSAATLGLGALIALISAAIVAVVAFIARLITEKDEILKVKAAKEALKTAQDNLNNARKAEVSAIQAAKNAQKELTDAEKAAGITGAELQAQVEAGTITALGMSDAQLQVYEAYLANEEAQKAQKKAIDDLTKAKKDETKAMWDNELALAAESGNYGDYKKSVVEAYEAGKLSADEARDLIEKSMSRMSDASQKTFMEDLPNDIKDGLNPDKYQTMGQKLKNWFGTLGSDIAEGFKKAWKGIGDFFKSLFSLDDGTIGKGIADSITGAIKTVINTLLKGLNFIIAQPFNFLNGILNKIRNIGFLGIEPFKGLWGQNPIATPQFQLLERGGVVDEATPFIAGENGKEVVIPLENNTEWMDIVADRLSSRMGGQNKTIQMNVDGRRFAEVALDTLNAFADTNGFLPLQIA